MSRRKDKPPYGKRATLVRSADYAHIFAASVQFDEIAHRDNYGWFLIRSVPIARLKPQTRTTWLEDPDLSDEEITQNEERYEQIENLFNNSEEVWPIIVSESGLILDGYHRLAVLNDLGAETVDVLWAVA